MRRRILLVDFDRRSMQATGKLLEAAGFDVLSAPTGREAESRIQGGHFDLVLLEPMIPGQDGFKFCLTLKRGELGRVPQVIIASRIFRGPRYRAMSREAGADAYLERPQQDDQLVTTILRLVPEENLPKSVTARSAALVTENRRETTARSLSTDAPSPATERVAVPIGQAGPATSDLAPAARGTFVVGTATELVDSAVPIEPLSLTDIEDALTRILGPGTESPWCPAPAPKAEPQAERSRGGSAVAVLETEEPSPPAPPSPTVSGTTADTLPPELATALDRLELREEPDFSARSLSSANGYEDILGAEQLATASQPMGGAFEFELVAPEDAAAVPRSDMQHAATERIPIEAASPYQFAGESSAVGGHALVEESVPGADALPAPVSDAYSEELNAALAGGLPPELVAELTGETGEEPRDWGEERLMSNALILDDPRGETTGPPPYADLAPHEGVDNLQTERPVLETAFVEQTEDRIGSAVDRVLAGIRTGGQDSAATNWGTGSASAPSAVPDGLRGMDAGTAELLSSLAELENSIPEDRGPTLMGESGWTGTTDLGLDANREVEPSIPHEPPPPTAEEQSLEDIIMRAQSAQPAAPAPVPGGLSPRGTPDAAPRLSLVGAAGAPDSARASSTPAEATPARTRSLLGWVLAALAVVAVLTGIGFWFLSGSHGPAAARPVGAAPAPAGAKTASAPRGVAGRSARALDRHARPPRATSPVVDAPTHPAAPAAGQAAAAAAKPAPVAAPANSPINPAANGAARSSAAAQPPAPPAPAPNRGAAPGPDGPPKAESRPATGAAQLAQAQPIPPPATDQPALEPPARPRPEPAPTSMDVPPAHRPDPAPAIERSQPASPDSRANELESASLTLVPLVRPSELDQPLRAAEAPVPTLPPQAAQAGIPGRVFVNVLVGPTGGVSEVRVMVEPGYGLGQIAKETVKRWRYNAPRHNGQPVRAWKTEVVEFGKP